MDTDEPAEGDARPWRSFDVVGIAGSLGGPEAVRTIVARLPADFPAAVIVVQHRRPTLPDVTVELLHRRSALPVRLAAVGQQPRPGIVDVAPAEWQLLLGPDGSYTSAAPGMGPGCAADPLFTSLAEQYGARSIGVVLSGSNQDGARGVVAIKARGGRILVQDHASARSFYMPAAALATGCVDFVLPPEQIAAALVTLVRVPGAADLFRVPLPYWAHLVA